MAVAVIAPPIPGPGSRDGVIAALGAALEGKLGAPIDVQVLSPHPAGPAEKGTL